MLINSRQWTGWWWRAWTALYLQEYFTPELRWSTLQLCVLQAGKPFQTISIQSSSARSWRERRIHPPPRSPLPSPTPGRIPPRTSCSNSSPHSSTTWTSSPTCPRSPSSWLFSPCFRNFVERQGQLELLNQERAQPEVWSTRSTRSKQLGGFFL